MESKGKKGSWREAGRVLQKKKRKGLSETHAWTGVTDFVIIVIETEGEKQKSKICG